ncbi:hypothetical protein [Litorihabitans aurantiacus]|uniref:Ribbon-helix-helix protein, CopG family n=1 Tax=Litorihabitans aurantiacus TaxID=1930061 RepID=A0AA38CVZ3_9MICO|nr:hypothetical protein [Litorihabitans aurantiacus]GMA33160.1 hypothetical protein GCM10025875_31520 [Litorihabitans aurantiacus]
MSLLEKRLQVLLDDERFRRLESESAATGRSVGSIVRSAIDLHFATNGGGDARAAAARRLLEATAAPEAGTEPDWAESKAAILEAGTARATAGER